MNRLNLHETQLTTQEQQAKKNQQMKTQNKQRLTD